MAKKFLTDIDLNKNELQNAVVQCLSTAPTGQMGQIYYNTGDKKLYQHDGTNWVAVGDLSGSAVTITRNTGSGDTLASYTISQGGVALSPTIDIPKDYLVKSAEINTVTQTNVPYTGAQIGDKYIDFVINTKDTTSGSGTESHIYLPINDLAHVYTAGNGIDISSADAISVKIDSSNANGLATTSAGLKLTTATTSAAGAMSSADKTKLEGIATGAEVNQNAFSNVKVGSTTVAADSKTDTLELIAGSNVTLTPNATDDSVTIAATDTTYNNATASTAGLMSAADKTKLDGIETGAEVNPTYTVVTGKPDSNQSPSFGATFTISQISQDATGQISATDRSVKIPDTAATTTTAGLMSATDKTNLDTLVTAAASAVKIYSVTSPSLTPSSGICTWTISNTSFGGENANGEAATCTIRDSFGNEVVADIKYAASSITIKFNASSSVSARTYTAVIIA